MTRTETTLDVAGMSCGSCVRHVTAALSTVSGVEQVEVRLRAGTVLVRHDAAASTAHMVQALSEVGYETRIRGGPLAGALAGAGAPQQQARAGALR